MNSPSRVQLALFIAVRVSRWRPVVWLSNGMVAMANPSDGDNLKVSLLMPESARIAGESPLTAYRKPIVPCFISWGISNS